MPDRRRKTLGPVNSNVGRKSIGGSELSSSSGLLPQKISRRSRVSLAPGVIAHHAGPGNSVGISSALVPRDGGGTENSTAAVGTPARKAISRRGRKSMGPGIPMGSETKNYNSARQSIAPNAGHHLRTDPRPVSDKSFINSSIKRLSNYLLSNGYDQSSLSSKSLSRPSAKDFMNMITFLLRKIDPNFNDPVVNGPGIKFEDEVTNAFKQLRYPFNVSKTALAAVGSPHTWPGLLAALAWLIELLECDEATNVPEQSIMQGDLVLTTSNNEEGRQSSGPLLDRSHIEEIMVRGEKSFTQFVILSYEYFLNMNDAEIEHCEEQLVEFFEVDNLLLSNEKDRLEELNLGLIEAVDGQGKPGDALPEWEAKRENHYNTLERLEDLMEQLNQHKEGLTTKANDKKKELQDLEDQLHGAEENLQSLKHTFDTQSLSVDDARRLKLEKTVLEDEHSKILCTIEDFQKDMKKLEGEIKRATNRLEVVVEKYNLAASELHLIPKSGANAMGKEFYARLEPPSGSIDTSRILGGVDMNGMVKPHLRNLQEGFETKITQGEETFGDLTRSIEDCTLLANETSKKKEDLESNQKSEEEALAEELQSNEVTLKTKLEEIESLEIKVDSVRDPKATEATLSRLEGKLLELNSLRLEEETSANEKKQLVAEEIHTAKVACQQYQEHVHRQLDRCVAQLEERKRRVVSQLEIKLTLDD